MKKKLTNGEPPVAGNEYEGYCIDLVGLVAKQANFEFRIEIASDYGRKNESTGQWSGMVGELINGVSYSQNSDCVSDIGLTLP